MSLVLAANNASTTITGTIAPGATTVSLSPGTGAEFPAPGAGQYFVASFFDEATGLLTEIVHVTNVTVDVATIVRAQEGTVAQTWNAGDIFGNFWTKGTFEALTQTAAAQNGSSNYGIDTGSANAYLVALSPVVSAVPTTSGLVVRFLVANANTGASTLDAGWGAVALVQMSGLAVTSGQILTSYIATAVYDQPGNKFHLTSLSPGIGQEQNFASGSTTNIGTSATNLINITGTTTITSFGSAASVSNPLYFLRFANILTLTQSSALLLPGGVNLTTAANDTALAEYLGSGNWLVSSFNRASGLPAVTPGIVQGLIGGFLPSSIGATTLTMGAGSGVDSTGAVVITLASPASWNVANGNAVNGYQGGSSLPNGSTIHWYAISGTSGTGSFASTSLTPTLPAGYTYYRRAFSFLTAAAGNQIHASYQSGVALSIAGGGLRFYLSTQLLDINRTSVTGGSRTLYTLSLPGGVKFGVIGRNYAEGSNSANTIILTSPDEADVAPATSYLAPSVPGYDAGGVGGVAAIDWLPTDITTNTSAQISARSAGTNALSFVTRGFTDFRSA